MNIDQWAARNAMRPRAANCGSHSVLLRVEDSYKVFPVRCGSWKCPRCCQLNTAQWARKVSAQAPTRFLTLTRLGDTRDEITRSLREFHRRLRAVGFEFEYWGMVELHRDGRPHWHALVRGDYIPPIALKWFCRESGIGHSDIRALNKSKGAVYYCCKHLGHAHGRRWDGRQIRYSRGFFINRFWEQEDQSEVEPDEVELVFGRADFVAQKMAELGYKTSLGHMDLDYLIGDIFEDGEIIERGERTLTKGYGVFKWPSREVVFYEE